MSTRKGLSVADAMSNDTFIYKYPLQWNIQYTQEHFITSFHTFIEQTINIKANSNSGVHETIIENDRHLSSDLNTTNYYMLSGLHIIVVLELLDWKERDL